MHNKTEVFKKYSSDIHCRLLASSIPFAYPLSLNITVSPPPAAWLQPPPTHANCSVYELQFMWGTYGTIQGAYHCYWDTNQILLVDQPLVAEEEQTHARILGVQLEHRGNQIYKLHNLHLQSMEHIKTTRIIWVSGKQATRANSIID